MDIYQLGFAATVAAVEWMSLTAPTAADERCHDRDAPGIRSRVRPAQ